MLGIKFQKRRNVKEKTGVSDYAAVLDFLSFKNMNYLKSTYYTGKNICSKHDKWQISLLFEAVLVTKKPPKNASPRLEIG